MTKVHKKNNKNTIFQTEVMLLSIDHYYCSLYTHYLYVRLTATMVLLLSSIPRTRNILHAFVLLLVLFSLTRLVTLPTKFPAGNNDPVYEIYKPIQRQRQNNQQLNNNNNNNHSESSSNNHMVQHRPAASYSALKEQQVALKVTIENNNEGNNNNNNNTIIHNNDNPYEGWQPIINNTEQDDSGNKKCNSWRTCFSKNHTCPSKCRDSLENFGTASQRPGFVPDHPYNNIAPPRKITPKKQQHKPPSPNGFPM